MKPADNASVKAVLDDLYEQIALIRAQIAALPPSLTTVQVQALIDTAIANVPTFDPSTVNGYQP